MMHLVMDMDLYIELFFDSHYIPHEILIVLCDKFFPSECIVPSKMKDIMYVRVQDCINKWK